MRLVPLILALAIVPTLLIAGKIALSFYVFDTPLAPGFPQRAAITLGVVYLAIAAFVGLSAWRFKRRGL